MPPRNTGSDTPAGLNDERETAMRRALDRLGSISSAEGHKNHNTAPSSARPSLSVETIRKRRINMPSGSSVRVERQALPPRSSTSRSGGYHEPADRSSAAEIQKERQARERLEQALTALMGCVQEQAGKIATLEENFSSLSAQLRLQEAHMAELEQRASRRPEAKQPPCEEAEPVKWWAE